MPQFCKHKIAKERQLALKYKNVSLNCNQEAYCKHKEKKTLKVREHKIDVQLAEK